MNWLEKIITFIVVITTMITIFYIYWWIKIETAIAKKPLELFTPSPYIPPRPYVVNPNMPGLY